MKPIVKNLVQLLSGQVQDDTCASHQELVNKVFGIAEEAAEVANFDDRTGQVNGMASIVAKRGIVAESKGDFDAIGPEAFGRELMGRDFYRQVDNALSDASFWTRLKALSKRPKRIGEAVQADTAALYEPINTWGSFVLGLYDHKILQGYESAPRVFEKLMPTVPTMVHGGQKHTLHDYDGTLPAYEGLAEGQEEDTARGVPAWVWSQQIKEFGLQYAITMEALKSDIDGGLGRRGEQIGVASSKLENYRAGSTFFGYNNKYCFNTLNNSTPSCNTFLSGTAAVGGWKSYPPFNYVNLFYSTPLLTADTLIQQYIAMLQLQAPVTNWRMDIGNDFYLVVSPTLVGRAMQIVHTLRDYLATSGGISPSSGVGRAFQGDNVLTLRNLNIEVVDFGIEWKDVLTGGMNSGNVSTITSNGPPSTWVDYAGNLANNSNANPLTQATTETPYNLMSTNNTIATAANSGSNSADNLWMLLSKKGTFVQRDQWIPLQPRTFLLSGTDMASRIGMRGDVIQASRFTTIEPRYAQLNLANASATR